MAKEGIITIKPLPKGEVLILSFNDKHKELVEYQPFKVKKNKGKNNINNNNNNNNNNSNINNNEEKSFKITELYQAPADLLPLFIEVENTIRKDSLFTSKEAVDVLWQYIAQNVQLQSATKQNVILNSVLARTVFKKKKNEGDEVSKKDLSIAFVDSLLRWTDVNRDGISDLRYYLLFLIF